MWCPHSGEHFTGGAPRTPATQPASDGISDVGGKGELLELGSLASNEQHPGAPVDVLEAQSGDFSRAQPQPDQNR